MTNHVLVQVPTFSNRFKKKCSRAENYIFSTQISILESGELCIWAKKNGNTPITRKSAQTKSSKIIKPFPENWHDPIQWNVFNTQPAGLRKAFQKCTKKPLRFNECINSKITPTQTQKNPVRSVRDVTRYSYCNILYFIHVLA